MKERLKHCEKGLCVTNHFKIVFHLLGIFGMANFHSWREVSWYEIHSTMHRMNTFLQ